MVDKSVINTAKLYISHIPAELELKKAYLFGSYARSNQHAGSDIDIALVVGKMDDFFTLRRELMRLRRNIDLRIEPHPFLEEEFTIQNPLAWEIERTGVLLFGDRV